MHCGVNDEDEGTLRGSLSPETSTLMACPDIDHEDLHALR
jgi:hypothetical protein